MVRPSRLRVPHPRPWEPSQRSARPGLAPLLAGLGALLCLAGCSSGEAAPGQGAVQSPAGGAPGAPPAQAAPPLAQIAALAPTLERIQDDVLASNTAFARLETLCRVAPGRLSGTPAAAAAVEFARQELVRLGADLVTLEPCQVPCWERGQIQRVQISAPPGLAGERFNCLALGGSVGTPVGGLSAPVLRVESFEELAARASEAKGAIVFFDLGMDPKERDNFGAYGRGVRARTNGAIEAAKAGAAAVVIRSVASALDDEPHTGAMRYQEGVPKIPAAALSTLGARRLAALCAQGPLELCLELDCRPLPPQPSFNVVADLLGREAPEQIVLVGGHLDSWDVAQGAHDDGAGCVHAMEVIASLSRLSLRPRRTVRVVLFMNEENGLAGATAYAKDHAAELDRHVLALESDAGGFTPRGFNTNAAAAGFAYLRAILDLLSPAGAGELVEGGGGADIGPLATSGVPLVGFRPDDERYFAYHHTRADTLAAVNPRELTSGAAAIAALIYAVAELETPIPRNLEPRPAQRPR